MKYIIHVTNTYIDHIADVVFRESIKLIPTVLTFCSIILGDVFAKMSDLISESFSPCKFKTKLL